MGHVDVWWGDARRQLPGRLGDQRIDFLFLDGLPKEYLEYLQVRQEKPERRSLLGVTCCLGVHKSLRESEQWE